MEYDIIHRYEAPGQQRRSERNNFSQNVMLPKDVRDFVIVESNKNQELLRMIRGKRQQWLVSINIK